MQSTYPGGTKPLYLHWKTISKFYFSRGIMGFLDIETWLFSIVITTHTSKRFMSYFPNFSLCYLIQNKFQPEQLQRITLAPLASWLLIKKNLWNIWHNQKITVLEVILLKGFMKCTVSINSICDHKLSRFIKKKNIHKSKGKDQKTLIIWK